MAASLPLSLQPLYPEQLCWGDQNICLVSLDAHMNKKLGWVQWLTFVIPGTLDNLGKTFSRPHLNQWLGMVTCHSQLPWEVQIGRLWSRPALA
jgi:hypothetical protein